MSFWKFAYLDGNVVEIFYQCEAHVCFDRKRISIEVDYQEACVEGRREFFTFENVGVSKNISSNTYKFQLSNLFNLKKKSFL